MSSDKIALINYKMGNLKSVLNAFKFLGFNVEITDNPRIIKNNCGIILPGVGAFGDAMRNLDSLGLIPLIQSELKNGKPYLGICLGYQMLFEKSEESSEVEGLGLFKGNVVRFKTKNNKIPQIGWNQIKIQKKSIFMKNIPDNAYVYFVHSYYPDPDDKTIILTTTDYDDIFVSSICKDNIFALQFHPEKSQDIGLQMLRNFGEYCVNHTSN